MRPTYSADAEAYREKVQAFLAEKLPPQWDGIGALEGDEVSAFVKDWRTTLFTAGYLAPGWPTEYGGAGLSALEQVIIAEEFAKAGVPTGGPNDVFGIQMLGNTLMRWGTDEQKNRYLPRILSGADTWCQGYSEPDAGSDLSNVGLRGVLDGDQWVLNGQKIWTSAGHLADHIFTLVRTDPDAPQAQGHLLHPGRHASTGDRGSSDQDDLRRERVQRDLLHRRDRAERRSGGRGQQRLGSGDDPARLRARRGGGNGAHPVSGRARSSAGAGEGNGKDRRSQHSSTIGLVLQQGADHAVQRHAHAHQVPAWPPARARRGDLEAVLERVPQGRHRVVARHPRSRMR